MIARKRTVWARAASRTKVADGQRWAAVDGRVSRKEFLPSQPDIADAEEGKIVTRLHRTRERNRVLVKRKKASFRKRHGRLFCEACGFDATEAYGERGDDCIECHHTRPIAFMRLSETTKLTNLVLLCANCHRVVHTRSPWLWIDQLKRLLANAPP